MAVARQPRGEDRPDVAGDPRHQDGHLVLGCGGHYAGPAQGAAATKLRIEVCGAGTADQRQRVDELAQQRLEHMLGAAGAGHRQSPRHRPADEDGAGAEGQRLDDVGAPPDAAVDEHVDASGDGVDDRGQRVSARQDGVELAAPVIGDHHARGPVGDGQLGVLGGEDALDQDRQLAARGEALDV